MKNPFFIRFLLFFNLIVSWQGFSADKIRLDKDWEFKNTKKYAWLPATVPGVVHLDLLENGLIEDPYENNNEITQQWIELEDWEYVNTINADRNLLKKKHIELVFEGLDTYTTILLNGKEILATDNMFRAWKIDIKPHLKFGENELRVIFHSPLKLNESNVKNSPYALPAANETVDLKVSPYVRKAAYHFGWDWGPRFVTCGIWRPVYLQTWNDILIEDVSYTTDIRSADKAFLNLNFEINCDPDHTGIYLLQINDSRVNIKLTEGRNIIKQKIQVNEFKKWNPVGYGNQHTKNYQYKFYKNSTIIIEGEIDVAFRTIELIHEKDDIGTSFYFMVNGAPFYAKGANYIPQDMFLPRVDSAQYELLIQQVLDANMNMIRVWGGGIYENDYFYDLCDQHGILVWQDFMFANSMYPNNPDFIDNIAKEVEYNIKRLRNHPSIALWCGNNEIEVAWKNWGWQKQYSYSKADEKEIWNTYTSIFHELIPQTLERLDPTRDYVPTTPLSNWGKPENFNHASMHYWGVWHGKEPIENYSKNVGRFISEYGYQSFPSYETLAKVIHENDLNLDSEIMKNRQKSYIGNGIIEQNVKKYAYNEEDFKKWCELTQLVQAHAYSYAIRQHRIQTPHCMGTLFWQLNDCWPGPSWSVIDYYGNKKAAYHEVADYYKPVIASSEMQGDDLVVTLVSDAPKTKKVDLTVTAVSLKGMSANIYNRQVQLDYLKPQEFYFMIPKNLRRKWCKKKTLSHFIIAIKDDTEEIFKSEYYPEDNATVKFPKAN